MSTNKVAVYMHLCVGHSGATPKFWNRPLLSVHNMEVFQGLVHKYITKWSVRNIVDSYFPGMSLGRSSTYLYYVLFVEPDILWTENN